MTPTTPRSQRRRTAGWMAAHLVTAAALVACTPSGAPSSAPPQQEPHTARATAMTPTTGTPHQESPMIVTVNGHDLHLKLADNSSARALADLVSPDAIGPERIVPSAFDPRVVGAVAGAVAATQP